MIGTQFVNVGVRLCWISYFLSRCDGLRHYNAKFGMESAYFSDGAGKRRPVQGSWMQLGVDLEYNDTPPVIEVNSLAMTPNNAYVAVGDGGAGRLTLYNLNDAGDDWNMVWELADAGKLRKAVDMSTDASRIVVGQYEESEFTGVTRTYRYNATIATWEHFGQEVVGNAIESYSGYSVAMSGDGQRIAVGSPYTDIEGELDKGEVRLYQWNTNCNNIILELLATIIPYISYEDVGPCWDQMGGPIEGFEENDRFGSKVTLSRDGGRVAVAATQSDGVDTATGNELKNAGTVRVYEWSLGIVWYKLGSDIQGSQQYAGFQMDVVFSADGRRIIVGYPAHDDLRGRVLTYEWVGSDWGQYGDTILGESGTDKRFGYTVATNDVGTRLFVGAPGASSRSGVANVFELDDETDPNAPVWVSLGPTSSPTSFFATIAGDGTVVASMSTSSVKVFTLNAVRNTTSAPTVSQTPSVSLVPTPTLTTNFALQYCMFWNSLLDIAQGYLPPPTPAPTVSAAPSKSPRPTSSAPPTPPALFEEPDDSDLFADLAWLLLIPLLFLILATATVGSFGGLLITVTSVLTTVVGVGTVGAVAAFVFWFLLWPFGTPLPGPF